MEFTSRKRLFSAFAWSPNFHRDFTDFKEKHLVEKGLQLLHL